MNFNLDYIQEMWEKDSKIESDNLTVKNIKITTPPAQNKTK